MWQMMVSLMELSQLNLPKDFLGHVSEVKRPSTHEAEQQFCHHINPVQFILTPPRWFFLFYTFDHLLVAWVEFFYDVHGKYRVKEQVDGQLPIQKLEMQKNILWIPIIS